MRRSRKRPRRKRVGRVSYYLHHGGWHLYYQEEGESVRKRVADTEEAAPQIAAQVNAQLAASLPTAFSFTPIDLPELRRRFLEYHENVLRSSLATVRRYRSATQHLETCRSMYAYAARKRHLPPYADNPFAGLGGKRFKVEDAKPIYVFDEGTEANFLSNADDWSFPIHFVLAKTGMRPGELIHLLMEDLDLAAGWLRISNIPDRKRRSERSSERYGFGRIPFNSLPRREIVSGRYL